MAQLNDVDMTNAGELGEGFKAIPPGNYQLYIESSDRETTKKGDAEYLKCVFVVADGEYQGAKIFSIFNLWNPNATAVEIAKSQWRAVCEATVGQPFAPNNDSASLHSRPFWAQVDNVQGYNKETGKNDHPTYRSNEIVFKKGSIRSLKEGPPGNTPPKVAANTQQAAPQQATGTTGAAPVQQAAAVKPGTGNPAWKR